MSIRYQGLFEFGSFRLDATKGILYSDSNEIRLAPKVFETLLVLVENHDVVLDKDYLLKRIWADAFVEEGSLARNISVLRRALGEGPHDERYIQTVPKRGYRFIAPVINVTQASGGLVVEEQTKSAFAAEIGTEPADTHTETKESLKAAATAGSPNFQATHARRRYLKWTLAAVTVAAIAAGALWYRKTPERQVMRLEMGVTPADELVGMACPVVALSPDGSRVVYVAREGDTTRLYVRPMDSREAKPIAGTEDAACTPFFSPDGQWLAFYSKGWLRKVFLGGGLPVRLLELNGVLGASWGDDGRIVFAGRHTRGIESISDSGGSRRFITTVVTDQGESTHRWPVVLPGSKTLLYTVGRDGPNGGTEIVLQRLDTGEKRVLIPGGTFPNFVTTGQIVYVRGGTLMAVPFDAQRLEITGPAIPVEEMVRQSGQGAAQFGLSLLGSLVYIPGSTEGQADNETFVWVDRNGNPEYTGAPGRVYLAPKVSPDGQTVAVTVNGDSKSDIWLYDLSRHDFTRLTFGTGINRFPVWTPDGKRLLFSTTRTGVSQIAWKASDGTGDEELITNSHYSTIPGAVSPDGTVLLYTEQNPQTSFDIWLVELTTRRSRPYLQSRFDETAPAMSPDGRWLAYVSNESGRNEIYIRPFPGAGPKLQVSSEGGEEPVWARNGRELFFMNHDDMMAVPVTTGSSSARALTAGTPQVLFKSHYIDGRAPWPDFDVSLDGLHFLMSREETATRINVVLNLFDDFR